VWFVGGGLWGGGGCVCDLSVLTRRQSNGEIPLSMKRFKLGGNMHSIIAQGKSSFRGGTVRRPVGGKLTSKKKC